jgi:hypothetical protein
MKTKVLKKRKNNKTIFKGEIGYGTKKKALDDMCKDNLDFDDLNDMFLNEDILMTIPDNIDIIFEDIDLDE